MDPSSSQKLAHLSHQGVHAHSGGVGGVGVVALKEGVTLVMKVHQGLPLVRLHQAIRNLVPAAHIDGGALAPQGWGWVLRSLREGGAGGARSTQNKMVQADQQKGLRWRAGIAAVVGMSAEGAAWSPWHPCTDRMQQLHRQHDTGSMTPHCKDCTVRARKPHTLAPPRHTHTT